MATDKCRGGPLADKYRAVKVNCPVMKPAGLNIEVTGGDVIPVDKNVTFNFTQEEVTSGVLFRSSSVYCNSLFKITSIWW